MNNYKQIIKTWRIILSILLILFMLLSMNIILPLRWRFPSWRLSPHLSAVETDTENGSRTDYVNSMGFITVALNKNYATIVKTLDQNGNCVLERYFDNAGKPAVSANGSYALSKVYNSEGQWITLTYLDNKLHPVTGRSGYATIHRTYNTLGKTETESYYDTDDLPATDPYKRYGIRYEYNDEQKISVITSLDADGEIMNNLNHYAVVKRTYTSDGALYTEMFYDENGNPAKLGSGQYGYVYVNGKPICLDKEGNRIFILRHFLLHSISIVLLTGVLLLLLILVSGRTLNWLILLLYLSFIVYMTMINREVGSSVITWTIPPNYYLFLMDGEILANIWLFIPLGAILYKLFHMWEMITLPIALTLLIEITQLIMDIGAFELSDLIANTLGGVIGIIVCYLLEPLINRIREKLRTRLS